MPQISSVVRAFLINRLLDTTSGFNYWVGVLAGSDDYPNVQQFSMANQGDINLFEASIDEAEIDDTEIDSVYPLMVVKSATGNSWEFRVTPSEYSGPVETIIDFYSGFIGTSLPLGDSETVLDMVEDAMVETFNAYNVFSLWQEAGLSYNNQLRFVRMPLKPGGPGWRQKERFSITVNLPVQEPRPFS